MRTQGYKHGDCKAVCDQCGQTYDGSALKKRWDGAMVCQGDWEPRQPQDRVRPRAERQTVDNPRPRPPLVFVGPGDITKDDLP